MGTNSGAYELNHEWASTITRTKTSTHNYFRDNTPILTWPYLRWRSIQLLQRRFCDA